VLLEDAERAINLFDTSVQSIIVNFGLDVMQEIVSGNSEKKRKALEMIEDACTCKDGREVDVVYKSVVDSVDMKPEEFDDMITELKREGRIFEPRPGILQRL
jgi:DNA replicative helicase MCM subunit Mcm2 (Cdc46/Mcm family)